MKTTNFEQGEGKTGEQKHGELLRLYRHVKPLSKHQEDSALKPKIGLMAFNADCLLRFMDHGYYE